MIGCVDICSYSATDIVLYLLVIGVNHTAILDLPPRFWSRVISLLSIVYFY